MYVWIILLCGTLCIIFCDQIMGVLFKYCHLDSLCDLDRFFLSKTEREIKKEQEFFLSASPSELLPIYNEIIKKYSRQSLSKNKNIQIFKCLPNEIFSFFSTYDAICIKHRNFVDIRELKKIHVNGKRFIIIGRDPESLDFFVVESLENGTQNHFVFQITNINDIEHEIITANSYQSFYNFVCFNCSYYLEAVVLSPT